MEDKRETKKNRVAEDEKGTQLDSQNPWIESLDLIFGHRKDRSSKEEKIRRLPFRMWGNELHRELQLSARYMRKILVKDDLTIYIIATNQSFNVATAALTVIFRGKTKTGEINSEKRPLIIPISIPGSLGTSIISCADSFLPDREYVKRKIGRFLLNRGLIDKDEIDGFSAFDFYHSEQALLIYLESNEGSNYLKDQISRQLEELQVDEIKIYGMILDIHTRRYICSNCESSIKKWINNFKNMWENVTRSLSANVIASKSPHVYIRVSACSPYDEIDKSNLLKQLKGDEENLKKSQPYFFKTVNVRNMFDPERKYPFLRSTAFFSSSRVINNENDLIPGEISYEETLIDEGEKKQEEKIGVKKAGGLS